MADLPPSDPADEIAALRDQVAELQAQLRTQTPADDVSELRRQLAAVQGELDRLRTAHPRPDPLGHRGRRLDGFFEVEDD